MGEVGLVQNVGTHLQNYSSFLLIPYWESNGAGLDTVTRISWSLCHNENLMALILIRSQESHGLGTVMRFSWSWYRHENLMVLVLSRESHGLGAIMRISWPWSWYGHKNPMVLVPSWDSHGFGTVTRISCSWYCHGYIMALILIPSWESRVLGLDTALSILFDIFLTLCNIMQIPLSMQLPLKMCWCPRIIVSYHIARLVSFILITPYYSCHSCRCRPLDCSTFCCHIRI
jgi:hypothetical protein